jgi:hypothetical protein
MESPERELAKELGKQFVSITEYEALKIACEIRRNNILKIAFGVREHSDDPTNLEAIAMSLNRIGDALEIST